MYRYPPIHARPGRVMAPPPPQNTGFGQGVKQFIDSYRGEQQAKKQQARQLFEQHARMLEAGLPVDKKKMAKWAREGDLHFDLDAPPPPPPQAPMTPDPRMQSAATVGMQQALGGPAAAPAPPPPRAAPPGGMRGLINRIGQATGVPAPPTQAEQMGAMRMLNEMQQRGAQNKEMAGMRADMQRRGLEALMTIERGLGAGLTMEDPRMLKALSTVRLLAGNGSMGGNVDKLVDNALARRVVPHIVQGIEENSARAKDTETREKVVSAWAAKNPEVSPQAVMAAMKGDFTALESQAGARNAKKMAEEARELRDVYENADAVHAYVTALNSGASLDTLKPLIDAMGSSKSQRSEKLAERRVATGEKQASTSARNASTSAARLGIAEGEAESAERVATVTAQALKDADMDVEEAKTAVIGKLSGQELLQALDLLAKREKGGPPVINLSFGEGVED